MARSRRGCNIYLLENLLLHVALEPCLEKNERVTTTRLDDLSHGLDILDI